MTDPNRHAEVQEREVGRNGVVRVGFDTCLQSEAVAVVGDSNVSNQLEIALPSGGERAGL